MKKGNTSRLLSRLVIYAVLILTAIYALLPVATIIMTSIRSEADLRQGPFTFPKNIQLVKNFTTAWIDGKFRVYFKNSIILTIPTVILVVIVSTLAGYSFAKLKFWGSTVLFYAMLVGMMIPFQAVMIPLYFLLGRLKILNTHFGVILVISAFTCSFGTFMMRAFFKGLPDELIEAAKIDSCNDFQTFYYVMLPLTFPAWISLIIFTSMWTWNNFLIPLLFIYDESQRPLTTALMSFQDRYTTRYTLIAAAVLMTIAPLAVLFVLLQKKFISSITMGAVKG